MTLNLNSNRENYSTEHMGRVTEVSEFTSRGAGNSGGRPVIFYFHGRGILLTLEGTRNILQHACSPQMCIKHFREVRIFMSNPGKGSG